MHTQSTSRMKNDPLLVIIRPDLAWIIYIAAAIRSYVVIFILQAICRAVAIKPYRLQTERFLRLIEQEFLLHLFLFPWNCYETVSRYSTVNCRRFESVIAIIRQSRYFGNCSLHHLIISISIFLLKIKRI